MGHESLGIYHAHAMRTPCTCHAHTVPMHACTYLAARVRCTNPNPNPSPNPSPNPNHVPGSASPMYSAYSASSCASTHASRAALPPHSATVRLRSTRTYRTQSQHGARVVRTLGFVSRLIEQVSV
eukprot:scaffold84456_cov62-Phaeocystis_antarctica.AAC.2